MPDKANERDLRAFVEQIRRLRKKQNNPSRLKYTDDTKRTGAAIAKKYGVARVSGLTRLAGSLLSTWVSKYAGARSSPKPKPTVDALKQQLVTEGRNVEVRIIAELGDLPELINRLRDMGIDSRRMAIVHIERSKPS